ncbi:YqgE/AlgH family protein [Candidatus Poriferisodalis sp.]|uniref:YqgE/AlgH family protein n=1 Tax=Candidatus Poriferisodalis sp. TaxID=3101277 RepID=UPI003D0C9BE3
MVEVVVTPVRAPSAGDLLVATPRLVDANFDRTVVYVIEHQEAGTLGVVINRLSEIACAEAVPRWASRFDDDAAVGLGGPVEPQGLLALGTTTDADAGKASRAAVSDLHPSEIAGAFRAVARGVGLVDLTADPDDLDEDVGAVRLYGGHAGWGPSQLQGELVQGCWWVFASAAGDLTANATSLWHDVLARQRPPARLLAGYPDDPALN